MEKVNEILNSEKYTKYLVLLEELEEDRVFCKHGIEHCLDVARIAYIRALESDMPYSKDIIYAIALLHDIGRVLEYKENIPHHEGSLILSKEILGETSFTKVDIGKILKAISEHRNVTSDELSNLIYESDKLSRNCFTCKSEKDCYWSIEKKNFEIKY